MVGSANSWGSLLGTGHLNLYFPERKVAVFVGTWNMNEVGEVDQQLEDFLLPISLENVPDIYAIGTQENVLPKSVQSRALFSDDVVLLEFCT